MEYTSWLSNNPIPKQALETGINCHGKVVKVDTALMNIRQDGQSEMIELTNLSYNWQLMLWGRGSMRDSLLKWTDILDLF